MWKPVRSRICAVLVPAALVLISGLQQAAADIFQVVITGTVTAGAVVASDGSTTNLRNDSFTSTFVFDSTLGLFQTINGVNQLTGGSDFSAQTPIVSASITIDGVGGFNIPGYVQGILYWEDGTSGFIVDEAVSVGSNGQCGNSDCYIRMIPPQATFQGNNVCEFLLPCGIGVITSATMTDLSVPSPSAGAGLPGLILAGGLLGWCRRKRMATRNA